MPDQKRLEQALLILLQPEKYKICEGCDSVVTKKTVVCPSCHAYRFNEDEDYVIKHTKEISVNQQRSVTKDDLFE